MNEQDLTVLDSQDFQERVKSGEEDTSDILVRKQEVGGLETKQADPDNPMIKRFVISSSNPDRDNDVINSDGWELKNFKKNGPILFAHDAKSPPVGKANKVFKENDVLKADIEFMPKEISEFAYSIYQMVENDFLRATSVGFRPLEFKFNEERGGVDFERQELMETSIVPVPANPHALIEARSKGIDTEPLTEWFEEALDSWLEYKDLLVMPRKDVEKMYHASKGEDPDKLTSRRRLKLVDDEGNPIGSDQDSDPETDKEVSDAGTDSDYEGDGDQTAGVKDTVDAENIYDEKTVLSYSRAHPNGTPKANKEREWDGPGEMQRAEVEDLQVMCAWRASKGDDEDFDKEDFKLPHHVAEGRHAVVWRGVVAAMASLMGARGGVDVPEEDRRGIYNHLAKHYREFDEEPPSFEAAEEQILAKDGWTMDYETGQPVKIEGGEVKHYQPKNEEDVDVKRNFDALNKSLQEVSEKLDKLIELQEQASAGEEEDKDASTGEEEPEGDEGVKEGDEDKAGDEETTDEVDIDEEELKEILPEILDEVTNEVFGEQLGVTPSSNQ